ncbi:hypothetical protein H696_02668 [Fonticula alba]|uniref:Uncharacterized protein n=1 Tax=Fonticula alba TaxID=691883 RepID=A0A058Z889_FONAL|nr:hypothetical protein H696_02668 [Fonticula alba]KCV70341.1 hypothetical protein H696_02668 [Fonticula alba]|eukprot:XP_009494857.1 hypothetical protein H696_02668 [Fonticula alba]
MPLLHAFAYGYVFPCLPANRPVSPAPVASQHSLSVAASRPVVKVHGFVVRSTDAPFEPLRLISPAELGKLADRPLHEVTFRAVFRLPVHLDEEGALDSAETTGSAALEHLARRFFHRSRAFFLEQNILVRMVEEHGIHVGHTVRLRFLQHVPANEAARLSTVSEAVDGSPAPEDPLPAEDPNATICGLEVRWSFEDDDVVSAIAGRAVRWLAP